MSAARKSSTSAGVVKTAATVSFVTMHHIVLKLTFQGTCIGNAVFPTIDTPSLGLDGDSLSMADLGKDCRLA